MCTQPLRCQAHSTVRPVPNHLHSRHASLHQTSIHTRVLSIDAATRKVSLSLKAELLVGSDDEGEGDDVSRRQAGKRGTAAAADFDEEAADAVDQQQQQQQRLLQPLEGSSGSDEEGSGSSEDDGSGSSDGEGSGDDVGSSQQEEDDVSLDDMDVSDEGEFENV